MHTCEKGEEDGWPPLMSSSSSSSQSSKDVARKGSGRRQQCRRIVFRQGVGVRKVCIDRVPIPSGSRARSWEPWLRTIPTGTDPNQPSKQASKQLRKQATTPVRSLAPPQHPLHPFEPTSHS
ncbi:hypothetical protein M0802_009489 [Mischocyttarus mexicanus]|nr:hypothetical protein M0802_009489 [Mischocyttarus mexicanus]